MTAALPARYERVMRGRRGALCAGGAGGSACPIEGAHRGGSVVPRIPIGAAARTGRAELDRHEKAPVRSMGTGARQRLLMAASSRT